MTVYGHDAVAAMLREHLPQVALLLGPSSIGKRTLAEHLADFHRIPDSDRFITPNPLSIAAARGVISFVGTRPFGAFKLVIGRLDDASRPALNALLKTLEEPPPSARFLLTCTRPTLPTVMSRCHVYRLGLLTTDQVAAVLVQRGMSPDAAGKAAAVSRGQVSNALRQRASGREEALAVLKAVADRDGVAFTAAFRTFDEAAAEHLQLLLTEAATGNWLNYRTADTFGLYRDQSLLRHMLIALHQHPAARSRLGVRAALEPFVHRP